MNDFEVARASAQANAAASGLFVDPALFARAEAIVANL